MTAELSCAALNIDHVTRVYQICQRNAETENIETKILFDADMAKESMILATASIKKQSSLAMLLRAQLSQVNVLNLLK